MYSGGIGRDRGVGFFHVFNAGKGIARGFQAAFELLALATGHVADVQCSACCDGAA